MCLFSNLQIQLTYSKVTYLNSGGQVGDVLKAVVTCDKFGKTLAYTSISFTNSKGEIAARGSHTKWVASSLGTRAMANTKISLQIRCLGLEAPGEYG